MALQFNGFNQRLEELIEYTGMTHKEVAAKSGVPKRVIDSYTSKGGSSHPSAENAIRLAKALGTTAEFLMTGQNPSPLSLLTAEQRNLVENIDSLPRHDKEILKSVIQIVLKAK